MEGLNKIIARVENILATDPWKQRDMLRIFLDELVEKRDAAIKAKDHITDASKMVEAPGISPDTASQTAHDAPGQELSENTAPSTETMLKDASEAVAAFDTMK